MGKAPADQFYWNDWLSDVELQSACTISRGVWINALCRMWSAKVRGELTGTVKVISKLCNCSEEEFNTFYKEAKTLGFCYANENLTDDITIRNRRMYSKGKEQESNRLRQQRWYEKQKQNVDPNATITPPSSSSSSSSIIKQPINRAIALPDWLDKELWKDFKDHRQKLRAPMTDRAQEMVIKKLGWLKDHGHNPKHLLMTAMERGWKSVFPPKEGE